MQYVWTLTVGWHGGRSVTHTFIAGDDFLEVKGKADTIMSGLDKPDYIDYYDLNMGSVVTEVEDG